MTGNLLESSELQANLDQLAEPSLGAIDGEAAALSFHIDELADRCEDIDHIDLQAQQALKLLEMRAHLIDELVYNGDLTSLYREMPLSLEQKEEIILNPAGFIQTVAQGFAHRADNRTRWSSYEPNEHSLAYRTQSFATLEKTGRPQPELKVFLGYSNTAKDMRPKMISIYSRLQSKYSNGYIRVGIVNDEITVEKNYWRRGGVQSIKIDDESEKDALLLAVVVDLYDAYRTYNPDDDALAVQALNAHMI